MSIQGLGHDGAPIGAAALVEFFQALAACPREGAGAWVFEHGSSQLGVLLVEDGLICWSTLPGRKKRLVEILHAASGSAPSAIEDALRTCIATKKPIADGLMEAGVATREQLVEGLKRDTLESLLIIAATPERRGIWRPHRGQGYGASIRFSLTELMVESVSYLVGAPREALAASAEHVCGASAHFLFVNAEGLPVVASRAVAAQGIPECLALARRADVLPAAGPSSINVTATPGDTRKVTVVWKDGPWRGIVETSGPPHVTLRKLLAREGATD